MESRIEAQARVCGGWRAYAGVRALGVSSVVLCWGEEVEDPARGFAHRWSRVQGCGVMMRM